MNLLITGSNGFIGTNLINTLKLNSNFNLFYISRYNKNIFPFIPEKIDYVIHLSSTHRLNPEYLVYEENEKINKHLIAVLKEHNLKSNILFTSSIHEKNDSYYGKSKKDGSIYLKYICDSWKKEFVKIIFPNVFGPFAKAYKTSVVSNFCNDIITGKESTINNVDLELIYIDEVIKAILKFKNVENFQTNKINLKELHRKINLIYNMYKSGDEIILKSTFEMQLFITLKSYII